MIFEEGLTFKMQVTLNYKLLQYTRWQMIEEPKEKEGVELYKQTALFARLEGFEVPRKVREHNSIRLSQQAIERYVEKNYISINPKV